MLYWMIYLYSIFFNFSKYSSSVCLCNITFITEPSVFFKIRNIYQYFEPSVDLRIAQTKASHGGNQLTVFPRSWILNHNNNNNMNKEKTLANLKQQFFLFFVDKYLRKSKVFDP